MSAYDFYARVAKNSYLIGIFRKECMIKIVQNRPMQGMSHCAMFRAWYVTLCNVSCVVCHTVQGMSHCAMYVTLCNVSCVVCHTVQCFVRGMSHCAKYVTLCNISCVRDNL